MFTRMKACLHEMVIQGDASEHAMLSWIGVGTHRSHTYIITNLLWMELVATTSVFLPG